MKLQTGYWTDFVSLLFPELCQACGESLVAGEKLLCLNWHYNLPFTDFHLKPDNMVAQQFWGKINLEGAYAMCYFTKGGRIQHLMHNFKYRGVQKIGNLLGNLAGEQLLKSPVFKTVDVIIPVPLHKSRLKKRGYNQSMCFAKGLSEKMGIPIAENNLIRLKATETQTHRSRFSRFENMQQVFTLSDPETLRNKHILLVDDVVTTGSTLEACGIDLLKAEGSRLSIATIACAE